MRETLKFNYIWRQYFVIDLNVAQLKFAQTRHIVCRAKF